MKKKLFIKVLFSLILFIFCLFIKQNFVFAGTLSEDINGINETKYPGVKSLIQSLQNAHSNYKFQVYYTGIDWNEAVVMEYQGHNYSPKNLFQVKSGKYSGLWYCPICGSKTYDSGKWCCASKEAIGYMLDPRNSIMESSVFQFKSLETTEVTIDDIRNVINTKYSSYSYINNEDVINAIIKASQTYGINAYAILAKIVNEQGTGTSCLVTGSGYNGYGNGYYNFFNVNASGNGIDKIYNNALKYAINKGWNSPVAAIIGGTEYYQQQFNARGQNTLYYQRFNVVYEQALFKHQYQQDIMGAETSGRFLKEYYSIGNSSATQTFIIPLYENMPKTAVARPSASGYTEQYYEETTVPTDKLPLRASPNSSRYVTYLSKGEKIKIVKSLAEKTSDGQYWDIVVTEKYGDYGYIPSEQKYNLPNYIFDAQYYSNTYSDVKKMYGNDQAKLIKHFMENGLSEGRKASPVFDVKYYLEANLDLKAKFGKDYEGAMNHFIKYGYAEYRKSSEEYDGYFYKNFYADLKSMSSKDLINHYLKYGRNEGRIAGLNYELEYVLFEPNIYAEFNPDLKQAFGTNRQALLAHWVQYGIAEGRMSSLIYSPTMYLALNEDLSKAFGRNYSQVFVHFIKYGIAEGRKSSVIFNVKTYISMNSDLKSTLNNNYEKAYIHFGVTGIRTGRDASPVFSVKKYLQIHKDLSTAFGTDYKLACIHYMKYGINEGRIASDTFNPNKYLSVNSDLKQAFGTNYKAACLHYLSYGINEKRIAY